MTDADPRRRFTAAQRNLLFAAFDGRCAECGRPLTDGWHADHHNPHSRGGRTDLANGRPLCPPCNLRKGARPVQYNDTFQPRHFQGEVVKSVQDGMASGRDTTVVLASPGSGKTLTYQAVATYLLREGLIDFAAVFVPRLTLAKQCEVKWRARKANVATGEYPFAGDHLLFDSRCRIEAIRHVPNKAPLTPPGETGTGIVTTYSALVKATTLYEQWAQKRRGRFLLVADEAQFCGTDDDGGGTVAGRLIRELHGFAAHTLLLTGTPYRSDGRQLILADYEPADESGLRRLVHHAEASYATGVADDYLRRFEYRLSEIAVRYKYLDGTTNEYLISESSADLRDVLRKPDVWEPLVDRVVDAVREKQRIHPRFRGLISCMEQSEARLVEAYLRRRHPEMKVVISVSGDGEEANRTLDAFKVGSDDILVTVRKAFIGYDCPEITVVGVLTHYRDWGHLFQLVGRGLRVSKGVPVRNQSCRVICPDDEGMKRFVEFMRGESEHGLRERARREGDDGNAPRDQPKQEPIGWVDAARPCGDRAVSNTADVDADQFELIAAIKHDSGLSDDVTKLAEFLEKMEIRLSTGLASPEPVGADEPAVSVPQTEQEQVKSIKAQTMKVIKAALVRRGIDPKEPYAFQKAVQRLTAAVNGRAGFNADEVRTVEQAMARLQVAVSLTEEVAA